LASASNQVALSARFSSGEMRASITTLLSCSCRRIAVGNLPKDAHSGRSSVLRSITHAGRQVTDRLTRVTAHRRAGLLDQWYPEGARADNAGRQGAVFQRPSVAPSREGSVWHRTTRCLANNSTRPCHC
jgi:hypothetical protein